MDRNTQGPVNPTECGGFSVVMAEKVLSLAQSLQLFGQWDELWLGNVTNRSNAYMARKRIMAVMAGLACGLRGISEGNLLLRTHTAMQQRLGGAFPDQGTIHRWLQQVTSGQAAALREHLQQVVRRQGRFWSLLRNGERLMVDCDAQGLAARGQRFEGAEYGYLGHGKDRGYQRYVAYAAQTREVLDEFLRPGNTSLSTQLPELIAGLNQVFADRQDRARVVVRTDAHGGTFRNLKVLQNEGYAYLCRMLSHTSIARLKREHCASAGRTFTGQDCQGQARAVECWDVSDWTMQGRTKKQGQVQTRAVAFRETGSPGREHWFVLLTDLDLCPEELWTNYHQRGGAIEEYNDQSERAFHLEHHRCGNFHGLGAHLALVGLCWNLMEWGLETLQLPPELAPAADREKWVPARKLDRSRLLRRAACCGLRLIRHRAHEPLAIDDTVRNPESRAWLRWLQQTVQPLLALAG